MFVLKPDYPALSALTLAAALATAAFALPGVLAPDRAAALWRRFPRAVWPGRVLSLLALAWTALWAPFLLLEFMPGAAPGLFPLVQFALVLSVAAVWFVLPELLSCRAAGMLLALLPTPLLSAARHHPSPARLLVVCLAYAAAVAGMFWIAKPWLLRDLVLRANATPSRARAVSSGFLALAVVLLALALFAFPLAPDAAPLS